MNDQFQHVMVLISIIIGLAITHLLSGVVDAVDRANDEDDPVIFSPLPALWAGTAFLWMINFWWFQFRLLSLVESWTLWRYLFIILYSVVLYVMTVILIPRDWNALKSYPEYFMRNRRWFFIALLLASLCDVFDSWLKGGWAYVADMGPINCFVSLLAIPVVVVGIRSRKIRTQTIIAALYFVLYVLAVFEYTPVLVAPERADRRGRVEASVVPQGGVGHQNAVPGSSAQPGPQRGLGADSVSL